MDSYTYKQGCQRNQEVYNITKPTDASRSDTITNLQGQRLAAAGKWVASSLILQCPIMMQNPSQTRWERRGRGYVLNRFGTFIKVWVIFFSFLKQLSLRNGETKSVAGWCSGKQFANDGRVFKFNMRQVWIYIQDASTTSSCQRAGLALPAVQDIIKITHSYF